MPNTERFIALDSLRGISALLVMISHYTWAYDYHFGLLGNHSFSFPTGGAGVYIFFIISGFVIFMTLDKTQNIQHFIVGRIIRLYPTYWTCMLITLLVITVFPVPTLGGYSFFEVLFNFTMIQGYIKVRPIDAVYWSLAIELFFYIIMGLLLVTNQLKRIEIISAFWLFLLILSIAIDYPLEKYVRVIAILNYAPLFIAGIMFYKIWAGQGTAKHHLLIIISFAMHNLVLYQALSPTEFSLKSAFVMSTITFTGFYVLIYKDISLFKAKWLLFFGAISYPLYLLHNVIGYSVIYRVREVYDIQIVYFAAAMIVSVLLSVLVHHFVEKKSFFLKKIAIRALSLITGNNIKT